MKFEKTAEKLAKLYSTAHEDRPDNVLWNYPSSEKVISALKTLIQVIFPGKSPLSTEDLETYFKKQLQEVSETLLPEIERAIPYRWMSAASDPNMDVVKQTKEVKQLAEQIFEEFVLEMPIIRKMVIYDVIAAYNGDPAAISYAEVKLAYPGVLAITSQRIAHKLYELDVPIIPRIMNEWTHSKAGIDIHPGATIGSGFFIDHGTGVVIGETAKIGKNVKIYQGVTLGAKSFPLDENGNPIKHIQRHPTVEDRVIIYANTTVLGGKTVLGHDSVIGGNVFITESVPPHSVISKAKIQPKNAALKTKN